MAPLAWRSPIRAVIISLCFLASSVLNPMSAAAVTPSPHFFGPTSNSCLKYGNGTFTCSFHNDDISPYKDIAGAGAWWTWKWPSTTSSYYSGLFKFDASVPNTTSWRDSIRRAVTTWNNRPYWSPVMTETTGSTYDIMFKYGLSSSCDPNGDNIPVWYACATVNTSSTASKSQAELNQWWIITYNSRYNWGNAVTGRFDIQSITTNELGHAWYLNHNPSWSEGVVQATSCAWGSTTCRDSLGRSVSCSNCGNRRSVLVGDNSTLDHIYGVQGGGGLAPAQAQAPMTSPTPNDQRVIVDSAWTVLGP
jgi:hypothetical protein